MSEAALAFAKAESFQVPAIVAVMEAARESLVIE
jgi:hypothetical protein